MMDRQMKITSGGQISLPAAVRKRWATNVVTLHDEGDRVVIEPVLGNVVDGARGAFAALPRVDAATVREGLREEEAGAELGRT